MLSGFEKYSVNMWDVWYVSLCEKCPNTEFFLVRIFYFIFSQYVFFKYYKDIIERSNLNLILEFGT